MYLNISQEVKQNVSTVVAAFSASGAESVPVSELAATSATSHL